MKSWVGTYFESSSGLTQQFNTFISKFRTELIKKTKEDFTLLDFSRGHFQFSGFMEHKTSGKIIYFSISDVRYSQDEWYNKILIRTAQHIKDYRGGTNNYTSFENINKDMIRLVEKVVGYGYNLKLIM